MINYLYIHIPFCIAKCDYCDFYSVPLDHPWVVSSDEYIDALIREMHLKKGKAGRLRTVYLGGGTPTLLSGTQIAALLQSVRECFSIAEGAEITIEANPGTTDETHLGTLRGAGVNRISIGVQSLADHELRILGRKHTAEDALRAVEASRRAGFQALSIDLIYGIPGQTIEDWQSTLKKSFDLSPEHVSAYELTPEENTPLHRKLSHGVYALPEESVVTEMYYTALSEMEAHGYRHYEISNFARPGYECIHNLNYWNRGEYLGIGAGAHSFFDAQRIGAVRDVVRYREAIKNGIVPLDEETTITESEAFKETIFLGLRKTEGIDIRLMPERERLLGNKAVDALKHHGLIELDGHYLRLSKKGLVLSNEVIVQLLS